MVRALSLVLLAIALPAGGATMTGRVVDASGRPIAGAAVTVREFPAIPAVTTSPDGSFSVAVPSFPITIHVQGRGARPVDRRVTASETPVDIVLLSVDETITVTATRSERRIADTAASIAVVSRSDIASRAGVPIDDQLRQIPGFTLFRRTAGRWSHPTTQGVSLRGIGASGAGRALVLADGIPLNDPFGGWVYWSRIPEIAIERAEVLRGGGSDLYGSSALGGVIQLVRREPQGRLFDAEASYGSLESRRGSLLGGGSLGPWRLSLSAEAFETGGYIPVPRSLRGAVDRGLRSDNGVVEAELRRAAGSGEVFVRGSHFDESRRNGTVLQTNDTSLDEVSAGGDFHWAAGSLRARVYRNDEEFESTFTAISADRSTERLTRAQRVPASSWGGGAQWSMPLGARNALVGGADLRAVDGTSREMVYAGDGITPVAAGGKQRAAGLYLEDMISFGAGSSLTLGIRGDGWENYRAFRSTSGEKTPFADRSQTALSPRISLLTRVAPGLSVAASAYRGFRAPTLNELYREFRVGNVVTEANPRLAAERMNGAEAGVNATARDFEVRGRLFWMTVSDAIANVTLSSTPQLITRQRRNLGRSRSRGAEIDADWTPSPVLSFGAGYLLTDARVSSFPADRSLEGRLLPQVPRWQCSLDGRYTAAWGFVLLQSRWSGAQYDDDQNQSRLAGFSTVDVFASHRIRGGVDGFLSIENLTGERVETARTPVLSVGPPRIIHAGVRFSLEKSRRP